ncbi:PA14 domain-containing protein [Streptomyces bottropensis]|uniref:Fibronectin type III n=2 Tax=Streptomyces bottropensis TaxID=42235 RepID=M3FLQ4_9ACTN|nr:PA14 domain-containing protein [Streptomyces bottropensis]EMF53009.1 fibronectin type III [Streptomyces bottropensis ATCC 25435]
MTPPRRTAAAAATAVVLATAGGLLTATAMPASAAVTCASPVFKRQFFANTSFSGTPKKTDCDSAIDQDWGTGAPATGVPSNNFGVRWTVTRDFGSGGPFTLSVSGLDGIRVYLDPGTTEARKIDLWKNVSTTVSKTVNLTIPSGKHTLRVDYVNWTGSAKVKFAYAPRTSATVDQAKPLAPTGTGFDYIIEPYEYTTAVVTWARNKEMDLAGYRVYRKVAGTSAWTRVGTTTNLSHSDTPPSTGQSYTYEVRAYDKAGNESSGSADQGPIPTDDVTGPAAPVLGATAVEASNNLTWTASADAVNYRVFRKTVSATSYTTLADTTSTSYTDTSARYGTAYDYKVSAIDAAGNATASGVVRSTRSITPPQNVTVTTPSWGAVFTWTEPAGGDTADYRVLRSETSADGSRQWTTADCRSRKTSTDEAGDTVRSCTDYDGAHGVPYHYVMTRKNTAGLWSTGSAELTVTRPGDEIPPPPVTGLTAEPLEYGVKLDWDDSADADLDRYEVYEQPTQWGTPQYIGTVDGGRSETVLPEAADGESTHFIVVAHDIYGNSLIDTVDPNVDHWSQLASKVAVTELDLTPTSFPEETAACLLYASGIRAGGVNVDPDCDDSVVTGAAGLNVHRWDRATSQYVRVNDVPLAPGTTYWVDTTAPAGTTLHYVVSVVAQDGSETFTNVDSAVTLPSGS